MTITTQPARNEFTANAGQTIFNYTFKIFTINDLNVYVTPSGEISDDVTDLTTNYTVTGVGDEDGGTITLTSGANINDLITIVSNIPSNRTTDYQNNGDFRPDTVNADFDRVVSIAKKIEDSVNRTFQLPQSQQGPKPLTLEAPIAGKLVRWKSDLSGFENIDVSQLSPGLVTDDRVVFSFDSFAEAIASTDTEVIKDGAPLLIKDRVTGLGVPFFVDVVLTASVTPDTFGIVVSTGIPTLSLVVRKHPKMFLDWFGGKLDGITDDADALEALDAFCATNNLIASSSKGDAFCSRSVTFKALWDCEGINTSRIIFDQSGGAISGIQFNNNGLGVTYGISNVTIACKGANGGTAIKTEKALYFTTIPKSRFRDIQVTDFDGPDTGAVGFITEFAWAVGLDVGDCQGLDIDEYYYYGNYDVTIADVGQLQSRALVLDSTDTLLFPRFGSLWLNAPRIGIDVVAKSFFFIDAVDITFSYFGFQALGANNFSEVFINRLAINAQKTGVNVENLVRLSINQGFVNSRAEGIDHGTEWVGYQLDNVTKSFIGSIHAQPNQKYGGTVAFRMKDCGGVYMDSLTPGANIDIGLEVDNTAAYKADIMFQSAEANAVPYSMINNARQGEVTVIASPSFSDPMFTFDGTIDMRTQIINTPGANRRSSTNEFAVMDRFDILDKDLLTTVDAGFRWINDNGNLRLQLLNDVAGTTTNAILFNRTGTTLDNVDFRTDTMIFNGGIKQGFGTGDPEGVITAPVSSTWHRSDGGAGTSFYVKESGTGNTGWAAK